MTNEPTAVAAAREALLGAIRDFALRALDEAEQEANGQEPVFVQDVSIPAAIDAFEAAVRVDERRAEAGDHSVVPQGAKVGTWTDGELRDPARHPFYLSSRYPDTETKCYWCGQGSGAHELPTETTEREPIMESRSRSAAPDEAMVEAWIEKHVGDVDEACDDHLRAAFVAGWGVAEGSRSRVERAAREWHESMNAEFFDGPRISRANDALHAAVEALGAARVEPAQDATLETRNLNRLTNAFLKRIDDGMGSLAAASFLVELLDAAQRVERARQESQPPQDASGAVSGA